METKTAKTLQECKDEYANRMGYKDWAHCLDHYITHDVVGDLLDTIPKLYAQSQTEELKKHFNEVRSTLHDMNQRLMNDIIIQNEKIQGKDAEIHKLKQSVVTLMGDADAEIKRLKEKIDRDERQSYDNFNLATQLKSELLKVKAENERARELLHKAYFIIDDCNLYLGANLVNGEIEEFYNLMKELPVDQVESKEPKRIYMCSECGNEITDEEYSDHMTTHLD